ncbi:MAG: hypothetical protein Q8K24_05810 [Hydrogenophaga sp.]|nr:hypothetical protein [Hydrogenophaga sp.]
MNTPATPHKPRKPRKARQTGIDTPMRTLLRTCTEDERALLAAKAGTHVNYLYAIAGCHREAIAVQKAFAIEDASVYVHQLTGGRTPIVTARQISTMCSVAGFCDAGA